MEIKRIFAVLFLTLILAACATAQTAVPPTAPIPPTQTLTRAPTSTPMPPPATATVTITPTATITPTSAPQAPLSAEGPWLVSLYDPSRYACCSGAPRDGEIKLINQDGTGYTTILLEECDGVSEFFLNSGKTTNYLAQFGEGLYLFRPADGIGMRIYREEWYGSNCHTYYRGDESGGLLAGFYRESEEVSPDLILFDLPGGEVRERIPLVECGKNNPACKERQAAWGRMIRQVPLWSPDGRYLAFVALRDATSSDIFLYDTENSNLQRLTNGPEWVNLIGWSPDGSQIIMGEILSYEGGFFSPSPYANPTRAVWSVSVGTKATKYLYTPRDWTIPHRIYLWLDDQSFIAYGGSIDPVEGAYDLRYVDTKTGTDRMLFDGLFALLFYDPIHEDIVLFSQGSEEKSWGLFWVSVKDGNLIYLYDNTRYALAVTNWDQESGLFVSADPCGENDQRVYAVDHRGNIQCIPAPAPTPAPVEITQYAAPNGEWSASIQEGLWLQTGDEPAVQVSDESPQKVVWCPDSSCLFYSEYYEDRTWTLYHVSLPDLTITRVAGGIQAVGDFQWLGGE